MQKHKTTTANAIEKKFWAFLGFVKQQCHSSSSTTRGNFFVTVLEIRYIIRTSKHHASTFQQSNSWNHAIMDESCKNIFICQTLWQHNFQNNQPFSMIQSLKWPPKQDLSKAYHDFGNREIRNLTKIEAQWWFKCCLAMMWWNRCTTRLVLMNGRRL